MKIDEAYERLIHVLGEGRVLRNEPMSRHTLTKMGGEADIFVSPETFEETAAVIQIQQEFSLPFMLLGNGSNLIVRDGGVRGLVMHFNNLQSITVDGHLLRAQGGADIKEASRTARDYSLTGLEFACGIPGTIGGAMVMNAGAYGGEVKDVISYVTAVTPEGTIIQLQKEELELDYRKSIIGRKQYIVLEAVFELAPGDQETIQEKMDDLTFQRESKQPLEYPSVGSVFKRPPGYFAGKLIQDSGLQGQGFGDAEVSTKHAGFIVNKGNATATDYLRTIEYVRDTVKEKFGVELELEAKIVGEELTAGR
ncbi:UDP-N-acetylmuramate dehydrogenase [Alkalicoccus urumqiensis]|uniref:UDP-N-acetylenolpyruvoylglucosamine reductase n=1 Tax=Alkalicoccus urumqiensis TaxID=1548213 RepID=A0A2P6MI43_ALKUR|nr:UDP-N-acetylmuramate dehydrogenase [Alkalicoccus urumqiensis]PRO65951.1 UDP-N-acetylmuramate dehydrogenase [Alkalicoccus urumqiensis]